MSESGAWCLIESDPGVFTELIKDLGVKDVQVEEIYSMDEASLNELKPVHGLIFLYKWMTPEKTEQETIPEAKNVFFARQMIENACATQAILSILMNRPEIDIGETLQEFKSFVSDFPPDLKGLAIGNSAKIRDVHNSFAKPDAFLLEDNKHTGKPEDAFHFIAYVPVDDQLYEINGLNPAPIALGATGDDWLKVAVSAIEKRIQEYSADEIRFNLMAVISDRKSMYKAKLDEYIAMKEKENDTCMDLDDKCIDSYILDLQDKIRMEEKKAETYKLENIRRKHNYIPFILNSLRLLAEKGQLMPLMEKAKGKFKAQNNAATL